MTTRKPNNAAWLRAVMRRHKLSREDVATMACVGIKAVERWLARPTASNYGNMPDGRAELIELKLPSKKYVRRARPAR